MNRLQCRKMSCLCLREALMGYGHERWLKQDIIQNGQAFAK